MFFLRTTLNRTPLLISRRATTTTINPLILTSHYHPEVHTPKGDDFFINASFPDDYEAPTLLTQRPESVIHGTPGWDEMHATLSEASVKADRGEAQLAAAQNKGHLDDVFQPEADLEPKIDEL